MRKRLLITMLLTIINIGLAWSYDGEEFGSNEPTDWTTGVVTVKVEEPGGLRLAVAELDDEEISRLKIIGQLNSSDLQYLAEGNGKIANLESIDMSEVTLDYDGVCYYSRKSEDDDVMWSSYTCKYYLTEDERTEIYHSLGLMSSKTYCYYGPNLQGVFSGKPYKHIVMPTSVKKAANAVFENCKNLQSAEFPSGMLSIGAGAFRSCERLQSIDIQEIDTISDHAFAGCRMLQSVDHMNNVKYIGSYAFSGCIMLNNIQFSENLTYIGECAFYDCRTLPTVALPSSLSSLSEGAFMGCSMLKQVVYSPELMQVDYSSFNNTPWLKSLPTENGIKYMGHIALCYDWEAEPPMTLDFREGTTYIADHFGLSVTQNITSIQLPTSLVKIGDNAFANTFISSLTLPENLEIIGARAFYNSNQLTKVTLSEKLRLIGDWAFAYCNGLTVINYNAIKAAGDNQFNNCASLEKVNVGAKVELLPDGIFADCKSLTVVKFEERNDATPLVVGNNVFCGCKNLSNIKLPDNTKSIGDAAFFSCSSLTTFTVPHGVSIVSGEMLSWCSGLTTVQLHEGITTIGDAALRGCSGLTGSLTIPNSVTSIGEYAFDGCSGFTGSLTIPNSVTSIREHAFCGCSGFTGSLTIPNSVTSIREHAFDGCSGFTGSLTIPNSVTSIGEYAFDGCSGFTGTLTIPGSVTSIGDGAFWGCSGFTGTLTIPGSVTSIGDGAFFFFDKRNFKINSTVPPTIDGHPFSMGYSCIGVPTGYGANYRANEGWAMYYDNLHEFGDANIDQRLTISDAVAVANNIIGVENNSFNEFIADINFDEQITVNDAARIVDAVLTYNPTEMARSLTREISLTSGVLTADDFRLDSDGKSAVGVHLDGCQEAVALQCDFIVGDDIVIDKIVPDAAIAETHILKIQPLEEGRIRMVIYSLDNKVISTENRPLFTIYLYGYSPNATGSLQGEMISVSTPDATDIELRYNGGSNLGTTGITGTVQSVPSAVGSNGTITILNAEGMPIDIYSIDGHKVDSFTATSNVESRRLSAGVYIVKTTTTITKIILK